MRMEIYIIQDICGVDTIQDRVKPSQISQNNYYESY